MKYKKMIRSNHRLLTNGFFVESYRYDAFGRRTATVNAEGTERHVWDGDERGGVIRAYLWGPGVDNLLAVRVGGRNYAALTDIQGTVCGYADERGEIAARWTYDAWGNVLTEEIAESAEALRFVRYRFQGREFSHATGLTNFRARWYDPTTGRWLSKDPIGLSGGLNLYVFCVGNPINREDPDGLSPDDDPKEDPLIETPSGEKIPYPPKADIKKNINDAKNTNLIHGGLSAKSKITAHGIISEEDRNMKILETLIMGQWVGRSGSVLSVYCEKRVEFNKSLEHRNLNGAILDGYLIHGVDLALMVMIRLTKNG